ncbi:MAG: L7Ae/L30e/S12e/Gadd45 family ribosomal protein, partial [Thiohalorhabdaceae bacterium]
CPERACLRKGSKSKGVAQVLGCRPPAEDPETLRQQALEGLQRMLIENLGHAHRAGAVVPGMERVTQALEEGQANWVLAATDAAERTRKWMATRAGHDGVVTALTKSELGAVLGTAEVGVLAITQPRLAEKIRTLAVRWNRLKEENGDGQG